MMTDDMELVREYARTNSEEAFAALVSRYVNLVYSVALRQARDPGVAEEVTQAVFILLARKAASLHPKTVLPGWLCRTARFVSTRALTAQYRRQKREQEAYVQSHLNEPESIAWSQVEPLLDTALAQLGEKDHDAIVLRFFQNKNLSEVGAALGASEHAAKKRVSRALEKLRKFFAKQGVVSTAVVIAGAISAHSVQAAPETLAKTITVVAAGKGAAASGSTTTLIKGALKIMAWSKVKIAVIVGVVVLAGVTTPVAVQVARRPGASQRQVLEDGSVLSLERVMVDTNIMITYGETKMSFAWGTGSLLVAEFKLTGPNAASNALVKPAFFRLFRFVVYGEKGIEYAAQIWPDNFQAYPDGCYGYAATSTFPRDAQWLGFRVEKRESVDQGGPWEKVADLKLKNPRQASIQPWVAESAPITKSDEGLDFTLGEVTVKTIPSMTISSVTNNIWNHVVTASTEVHSNGVLVKNWAAEYGYIRAEDASGNWGNLAWYSSLDPRYVWKIKADFEMQSDFPAERVATITLPVSTGGETATIVTNIMNTPVTISWDGYWLDASMPENDATKALKFVGAENDEGEKVVEAGGSWSQFRFRKGSMMVRRNGTLIMDFKPATTKVTVAVVPNVHVEFFTQPKLVGEERVR
jgi:RNA polymerase sigma factor (sigma-70 family)